MLPLRHEGIAAIPCSALARGSAAARREITAARRRRRRRLLSTIPRHPVASADLPLGNRGQVFPVDRRPRRRVEPRIGQCPSAHHRRRRRTPPPRRRSRAWWRSAGARCHRTRPASWRSSMRRRRRAGRTSDRLRTSPGDRRSGKTGPATALAGAPDRGDHAPTRPQCRIMPRSAASGWGHTSAPTHRRTTVPARRAAQHRRGTKTVASPGLVVSDPMDHRVGQVGRTPGRRSTARAAAGDQPGAAGDLEHGLAGTQRC